MLDIYFFFFVAWVILLGFNFVISKIQGDKGYKNIAWVYIIDQNSEVITYLNEREFYDNILMNNLANGGYFCANYFIFQFGSLPLFVILILIFRFISVLIIWVFHLRLFPLPPF